MSYSIFSSFLLGEPGWEGKALLAHLPISEWLRLSNSKLEYWEAHLADSTSHIL